MIELLVPTCIITLSLLRLLASTDPPNLRMIEKTKYFFMDRRFYHISIPLSNNKKLFTLLLFWCLTHQDLIFKKARRDKIISLDDLNIAFSLPEFNKMHKIKTAFGYIHMGIVSSDGSPNTFIIAKARRHGFGFGKILKANENVIWQFLKYDVIAGTCFHDFLFDEIEKMTNNFTQGILDCSEADIDKLKNSNLSESDEKYFEEKKINLEKINLKKYGKYQKSIKDPKYQIKLQPEMLIRLKKAFTKTD